MKTAKQIIFMSNRDLQRLVSTLQVKVAEHERALVGGGLPEDWPLFDAEILDAKRIKREIYTKTRFAPKRVSGRRIVTHGAGTMGDQ